MSKYYSINKFSKILGVSAQTLRNWDKKGKLHPHHTSSNGYRYYSHEQLNQVMNVKPNLDRKELMKRISQNKVDKVVVFYKDRLNILQVYMIVILRSSIILKRQSNKNLLKI
ncbi:MAG: MerR family DNA-binding transcriptional regulator [Anaerostipes hadrus]